MDNKNIGYLESFYKNEQLHMSVYKALTKGERNRRSRRYLSGSPTSSRRTWSCAAG